MTLEERLRLMIELDHLIKRKYKGSPNEYAQKLGISRSAFFRLLNFVKFEFQAPLTYNKSETRYEYEQNGVLHFGFIPSAVLSEEGLKNLTSRKLIFS